MSNEKYGFVYVWQNTKKNKFYVGCHWGTESDGYICSSKSMRNAYTYDTTIFKRRVVQRIYTNRQDLLEAEHKWLSQIKDEELGKKFYNLSKRHFGHWTATDDKETILEKISNTKKGKKMSEETKQKIRDSVRNSWKNADDRKARMSERTSLQNSTKVYTEDERKKLADRARGNKNMLGKTHTQSARSKMSAAHKKLAVELNYASRFKK